MKKFKYIIELKVGQLQINDNKISEVIELNSTSQISITKSNFNQLAHDTQTEGTIGTYLNDNLVQSDKQLSFILKINSHEHQFAPLDNNLDLLNKWIDKLMNV